MIQDLDLYRHLLATCERIAKQYKVSPKRVSISFEIYDQADDGPAFSIVVLVPQHHPHAAKRVLGVAATLKDAEAELARKMSKIEVPR